MCFILCPKKLIPCMGFVRKKSVINPFFKSWKSRTHIRMVNLIQSPLIIRICRIWNMKCLVPRSFKCFFFLSAYWSHKWFNNVTQKSQFILDKSEDVKYCSLQNKTASVAKKFKAVIILSFFLTPRAGWANSNN